MSLSSKQVEAFVAVAELGSFRRAAERLNTTQPNISARIANLEQRLGLTLMTRDAGSVRLTDRGKALLPLARDAVEALDAFVAAAGDDALFQGVLHLGVTELVAHTWLSRFMVAMRDRFPNVLVELTVDVSDNISAGLFAREIDLAIQNGPFARPASGSVPLDRAPMVWIASARLADADTSEALARHPVITHARGTIPFRQIAEHFRKTGLRPRLIPSSNIAACLQMTLDGLGIACLPEPMVVPHLAAGRLVRLSYGWHPDDLVFEARYDAETAPRYLREAASLARKVALGG